MWILFALFGNMNEICSSYMSLAWDANKRNSNGIDAGPTLSLVLFLDNGMPLEVPCPQNMDNQALLKHVMTFYHLQKMRSGILEALGFRTLGFVEMVHMHNGRLKTRVIGQCEEILDLGRYKGSRMINFLRRSKAVPRGDSIVNRLKTLGVLTEARRYRTNTLNDRMNSETLAVPEREASGALSGIAGASQAPIADGGIPLLVLGQGPQQNPGPDQIQNEAHPPQQYPLHHDKTRALNFVSTWHTDLVATAVILPAVVAIVVSIVWPLVAVVHFHADMQTRVQTGFSIAGFIVTTGM